MKPTKAFLVKFVRSSGTVTARLADEGERAKARFSPTTRKEALNLGVLSWWDERRSVHYVVNATDYIMAMGAVQKLMEFFKKRTNWS